MTAAPANPHAPDFTHVETWVFDLDHTLYTVDAQQNRQMSARITRYVAQVLGLPEAAAVVVQKRYLNAYGSTLAGLVRHHQVDADHYHDFVNDIDALTLAEDTALRASLTRLPGTKLVFTNNCGRYARAVATRLGIAEVFSDIIDAKAMQDRPKPNLDAYRLLTAAGARSGHTAMFDDRDSNLAPAHHLGFTTVWCRTGPAEWTPNAEAVTPAHIHHETGNLADFLAAIRI